LAYVGKLNVCVCACGPNATNVTLQFLTFLPYIREVSVSILGPEYADLIEVFRGFRLSVQAGSGIGTLSLFYSTQTV